MYFKTHKIKLFIAFSLFFTIFAHAAFAQRLAISSSVANIRSGPGTEHEILWKVEKYHPIIIVKKSGKWYYFSDFEKDEGWIHKSLVQDIQTVITVKKKCNIRSGPDTKYNILFTVENGIPFKVLKRQGNWINIIHGDGDKGWIHKSLVW